MTHMEQHVLSILSDQRQLYEMNTYNKITYYDNSRKNNHSKSISLHGYQDGRTVLIGVLC